MAVEYPIQTVGFEADSDLSTKQHQVVIATGLKVDLPTTGTAKPLGVLQNKPSAGETADVMLFGVSKVDVASAVTGGDLLHAGSGQAKIVTVATTTTEYVFGQVIPGGGTTASAGTASVVIMAVPHRGN